MILLVALQIWISGLQGVQDDHDMNKLENWRSRKAACPINNRLPLQCSEQHVSKARCCRSIGTCRTVCLQLSTYQVTYAELQLRCHAGMRRQKLQDQVRSTSNHTPPGCSRMQPPQQSTNSDSSARPQQKLRVIAVNAITQQPDATQPNRCQPCSTHTTCPTERVFS